MEGQIGNYIYLLLFILLPLLGIVIFYYQKWVFNRKQIFAEERFQSTLFQKSSRFSKVLPVFYFISLLFLIFSFADYVKGGEKIKVKQKVNNVMFVLDVSNSMNAEDAEPTRLEMAKNIMLNTISKMDNDRVGVVIFAGDAVSIMPLTTDYNSFENYISGIETSTIKVQGTDFLKAMKVTADKFKNIQKGSRKVMLLSDGEDNEGNEEQAIEVIKNEGLKVFTVGIGTTEGAPIPEYIFGQFMGYKINLDGNPVITQKQTLALKKIARASKGEYIDVSDLENTTNEIVANLDKGDDYSEATLESKNMEHYYQYFLGVTLFFLFLIYFLNPKRDFNL